MGACMTGTVIPEEKLLDQALHHLLHDMFTCVMYANKVSVGQSELLETASATMYYFMNDAGRLVLREVLEEFENENMPRGTVN